LPVFERVKERRSLSSITYPPDPLPLVREGGVKVREGASPQMHDRESKRDEVPLQKKIIPFPLIRGRG